MYKYLVIASSGEEITVEAEGFAINPDGSLGFVRRPNELLRARILKENPLADPASIIFDTFCAFSARGWSRVYTIDP